MAGSSMTAELEILGIGGQSASTSNTSPIPELAQKPCFWRDVRHLSGFPAAQHKICGLAAGAANASAFRLSRASEMVLLLLLKRTSLRSASLRESLHLRGAALDLYRCARASIAIQRLDVLRSRPLARTVLPPPTSSLSPRVCTRRREHPDVGVCIPSCFGSVKHRCLGIGTAPGHHAKQDISHACSPRMFVRLRMEHNVWLSGEQRIQRLMQPHSCMIQSFALSAISAPCLRKGSANARNGRCMSASGRVSGLGAFAWSGLWRWRASTQCQLRWVELHIEASWTTCLHAKGGLAHLAGHIIGRSRWYFQGARMSRPSASQPSSRRVAQSN